MAGRVTANSAAISPAVRSSRHTRARICRRVPSARARNIASMVAIVRLDVQVLGRPTEATSHCPSLIGWHKLLQPDIVGLGLAPASQGLGCSCVVSTVPGETPLRELG